MLHIHATHTPQHDTSTTLLIYKPHTQTQLTHHSTIHPSHHTYTPLTHSTHTPHTPHTIHMHSTHPHHTHHKHIYQILLTHTTHTTHTNTIHTPHHTHSLSPLLSSFLFSSLSLSYVSGLISHFRPLSCRFLGLES